MLAQCEEVPGQGDADADVQSSPPGIVFHPASAIDAAAVTQIQATLHKRILRVFVGRGALASFEAKEMLGYQHSEHGSGKRSAKADELHLTPLELIDRIAVLVPPPQTHWHRYFDVLAPNSPHRAAVTALEAPAQPAKQVVVQAEPANMSPAYPAQR